MRTKHQLILDSRHDQIARMLLEKDNIPWYIPDETRDWLIEQADFRCKICGRFMKRGDLQIDHIHPVSRGGTALFENLQVLCRTCNLQKSNHILDPESYNRGFVITNKVQSNSEMVRTLLSYIERNDT